MNIGIDSRAKSLSSANSVSGSQAMARQPLKSKIARKPIATTIRPMATEMPEKSTRIVATATSAPRVSGSNSMNCRS
ncbi:MAG: hypothetical protein WD341_09020 [Tistlia sp.]|uniref:hypothetical protein n=1 Tax=Tistlia sp. TaxID=3057121 RepID=UPI0034A2C784